VSVVGVFPNEMSAATLTTEIALRSSEQWAVKRYRSFRWVMLYPHRATQVVVLDDLAGYGLDGLSYAGAQIVRQLGAYNHRRILRIIR
jgi:hypothetical protein